MHADASWWATAELSFSDLGDRRLDKRLALILSAFVAKPLASISAAFQKPSAIKAAYRFFQNKLVTQESLLSSHALHTAARCDTEKVVLCIQDTTSANFSSHKATSGLGHIGSAKARDPAMGLFIHTALATTTSGTPLGLLAQHSWSRQTVSQDGRNGRKVRLRRTPLKDKESFRWIEAMRIARSKLVAETKIINVCDRECDIYEFMTASLELDSSFVIRAKSNRKALANEGDEEIFLLSESFRSAQPIGKTTVTVHGNGERESRQAEVSIFVRRLTLQPPERPVTEHRQEPLELTVLHAVEMTTPDSGDRISWLLLSDLEVPDLDAALKIVAWYTCRWRIEEFHKVLKSGCQIEAARLGDADRLIKVIALKSIAAARICQLTYLHREQPKASADIALSELEWKCAYITLEGSPKRLPTRPPSLSQAIVWIARLGGFTEGKGRLPGIVTIWRGWQTLNESLATWKALSQAGLATYG